MQVKVESETFDMPGYAIDDTSQYTGKDGVNYVDSACAWNQETGTLSIFVINRNETENYPLDLDLRGFSGLDDSSLSHYEIYSDDISAITDPDHDDAFSPEKVSEAKIEDGVVKTHIRPLSWNVITVKVSKD